MIGVFDSGSGGLTVLRALVQALPKERFVYLGDHAYAPYGMRSEDEIFMLTRRRVSDLVARGCSLIILACNTASALALRRLQQEWLPSQPASIRLLGVFVPVIEALSGQDWYVRGPSPYAPLQPARTIGLFGTRRTVESRAFPTELSARAPKVSVIQQSCPHLAEAIEEGRDEDLLRRGVARYCEQLVAKAGRKRLDLVVLGCTHYPLVEQYFRDALPRGVKIMDQATIVAEALVSYLQRHPAYSEPGTGGVQWLTSGDPQHVTETASRFFGSPVEFQHLSGYAAPKPDAEEAEQPDAED